MRSMLTPSLVWRMAWRYLWTQPRQTLLTVLGGCIGAALIMATVVFFQSFDESGNRWLKQHYGPIDWELKPPAGTQHFTQEEVQAIAERLQPYNVQLLPAVIFETSVSKVDGQLQPVQTGLRYLAIGVDFAQAAEFDPDHPLWELSLSADQVILSEAIAKPLGLVEGDTVAIPDKRGNSQLFQVKKIVKEKGMTGYRGLFAAEGTLIMGIRQARNLSATLDGAFTSILAGREDYALAEQSAVRFPTPLPLFDLHEQKVADENQVNKMKQRHGAIFIICSITAILAGALLMIQILQMLVYSRKESIALLRALGFQNRQVRAIFFIETTLINLLSTGVGIVLGIPLGFGVIRLFEWFNQDLLYAYGANSIPIMPYVSFGGIALSCAAVLGLLTVISFVACYRMGKMNIVLALRGDQDPEKTGGGQWIRKGLRIVLTVCAAIMVCGHFIQFFSGKSLEIMITNTGFVPHRSLSVLALWFGASVSMLYLVVQGLPYIQKGLKPLLTRIGIGDAAQILAFRYPAGNYRRTFIVTLLFSCCFMVLVLILIVTQHNYRDISQKSYSILGYPAYIKYYSEQEKQQILAGLQQDPELAEAAQNPPVMEPYMLGFEPNDVFLDLQQLNLTVPSEAFLAHGAPKLSQRSPAFASDEEAWAAVLSNPQAVILDHKYSYEMSTALSRELNVGDHLTLNVYNKPAEPNTPDFGKPRKVVDAIDIDIIGFADTSTGMEFYNVMFVHPQIYDQLKEHGYRWEYLKESGYVLLSLPSNDLRDLRKIEQRLAAQGIKGFYSPGISKAGEDMNMIQMLWIFIGFMTLVTLNIGLAGLAILQYRAVQERAKTLAMMRCIGLSIRLIRQMLLLEGTTISWLGLLNGCLFGSIGGYTIVRLAELTKPPTSPALSFDYPWEIILPIIGTLMLIAFLLNLAPSRKITRLSPGEAIRSASE
ncbi:ABC transporter permease [Paenibacillus sp. J2TS4]|uniref:ABC transporter permease n=1 Tax=Paenibacillus sp. J2TS4 TaxID=2807194 RepID=UPI001AFED246|nr:ABC transporter permease [Paenibacillus sp. J2TS4]GIP31418.1 hypothetical protein J2TS4_06280 [Paenibacillus sp. J2TS4]